MKAHIVEGGVIVNSIEVSDLDWGVGPGQTLIPGDSGGIGWQVIDGVPIAPVAASTPAVSMPAVLFLDRLTADEYAAARRASNSEVQRFLDSLIARQVVDFSEEATIAGFALWVSEGIVTANRLHEIRGA